METATLALCTLMGCVVPCCEPIPRKYLLGLAGFSIRLFYIRRMSPCEGQFALVKEIPFLLFAGPVEFFLLSQTLVRRIFFESQVTCLCHHVVSIR